MIRKPLTLRRGGFSFIAFIILTTFIFLFLLSLSVGPGFAGDSNYSPEEAGHPIRLIAYIFHPVGVLIDYTILRPAYWIGQKEPFATIFGQKAEFGQGGKKQPKEQ